LGFLDRTMHKYILPTVLLALIIACNHQKTNTAGNKNGAKQRFYSDGKTPFNPNLSSASRPDYHPSPTREVDILHTKLDARFDWAKRYMYGKAIISAKPYFYPITHVKLDARGMELKRVAELRRNADGTEDTVTLAYKYDKKIIDIDLGRELKRTDYFNLYFDYIAKPDELEEVGGSTAISEDKGLYFINPDGAIPNKPRQIWTQGETQANSVWLPTIDRTNEKMTHEIAMTVEEKYVTLSNGNMISSKKNTDGTRTDVWRMDYPNASYLLFMGVGEFAIVKDKWRDKEVNYYVEPEFEPYARMTFGKTPEMMECFSKLLGVDYPWSKYSQLCARDYVSGAMENTSCTLHSDFLQRDDREYLDATYEDYISHELFHQWFGDYVTCESWANLPLNESFATYGEYLWDEYKYGKEEADYGHYNYLRGYLRESAAGHPEWEGKREPLIRFYYADKEDMFDSHSYNKGGQVLHFLRNIVGDEAFFASLKLYLETNKFQNVEIADLRLAFEKTTGQDLNWFFDEWFMSPGHPEFDIAYSYDVTKKQERVIVKQIQDRSNGTPVFRLPVSIDLYEQSSIVTKEVWIQSATDTFWFDLNTAPVFVNFDSKKIIPCYKKDQHTTAEWIYLLAHSKLYVDKQEAINALLKVADQDAQAQAALGNALNDSFWAVRERACDALGKDVSKLKDKLISLAKEDPKSAVRAAALSALSEYSTGDDLKDVYLYTLKDKSYMVMSRGLVALMRHFPETGKTEAKKYENDTRRSMRLVVGAAYAEGGNDENLVWFQNTMPELYGQFLGSFLWQYYTFLTERCSAATVEKGIATLETLHKSRSSSTAITGSVTIVRIMTYFYKVKREKVNQKSSDLKSVNSNASGLQKMEMDKATLDHLIVELEAALKRMTN
jgi:aminopeptidase N